MRDKRVENVRLFRRCFLAWSTGMERTWLSLGSPRIFFIKWNVKCESQLR